MEVAADAIDRVISIEMRRRGRARGFKAKLAAICREAESEPLVLAGARVLNRVPGRITIVTGAAVPDHMPVGENDGPFGACVLASKLEKLGHKVTIWSDPECVAPIQGLSEYLGTETTVRTLEKGNIAQQEAIVKDSDVLIAIERLGGNPNGHLHGISGKARDAFRTNVDHMFKTAANAGISTLAVGDGGNEIGFGKVRDRILVVLPDLNQPESTPCGAGIISVIPVDSLVFATTSNLGVYGILAGLALLRNDLSLCHDADLEEDLHYVGVGLGLVDGGGGGLVAVCDGIPADCNAAIVRLVQNIVERYLEEPKERAF